jgi:hypothetical protein
MAYFQPNNNRLSQVTTYSGSDITVIAYRDGESPAMKFLKGQLNQEINLIESNIKSAEQDLKNIPIATTSARNEIEQQWDQFYSADVFTTGLNPDSVGTTRLPSGEVVPVFSRAKENWEGIVENRYNNLDNLQNERIQKVQQRIQTLESQKSKKEKELAELRKTPLWELGSIHTISYSSFREKFAVRSLGMVAAKGYTHGPRTIAGTMVFNVLQAHELYNLASSMSAKQAGEEIKGMVHPGAAMLDQIEPFNIILMFANEFGVYSSLHLFDVTISTEGQSMSVDEIVTQNTMNFYALEMLPMLPLGNAFESTDEMIARIINSAGGKRQTNKDGSVSKEMVPIPTFDSITSSVQSQKEINELLKATRGLF